MGTKFGPPADQLDVEVVINLDTEPHLRDAFNHNWVVNLDYDIEPDKKNGVIVHVWLTKDTTVPDVGSVFK